MCAVQTWSAVAVAAASLVATELIVRRVRWWRARRDGPELALLRRLDPALRDTLGAKLFEALEAALGAPEAHATRQLAARLLAATPAIDAPLRAALQAHLAALAVDGFTLEFMGLTARRPLARALEASPSEVALHLASAHLEAALGEPATAADALAAALFHARGEGHVAALVGASAWLRRHRPGLLDAARRHSIDTPGGDP